MRQPRIGAWGDGNDERERTLVGAGPVCPGTCLYEHGKCIDPDPVVAADYVKEYPRIRGFEAFAGTLDQDYLATYPNLPGWQAPAENPCLVLRRMLLRDGELAVELRRVDTLWNQELDRYFRDHPEVKREWNIYPQFDRRTGLLGTSRLQPTFAGQ